MVRVICLLIGYVFGLFQTAYLYGRLHGVDIRNYGSGNAGTTNTLRVFGTKAGLLVLFGDILKCILAVVITGVIFGKTHGDMVYLLKMYAAAGAIIGHNFPFYLKFKGGKGIATTYGVFWFGIGCENPWYFLFMLVGLILVLLFILVTEMGSMGSLLGVTAFSVWQGTMFYSRYVGAMNGYVVFLLMMLLFMNFLTWFSHRKNLVRLFAGEEHRTSVKKLHGGKRGMDNM